MNKREFLDSLRKSLSGEVPLKVIEENIQYYDEYISSSNREEEHKKIEEIGDPRLIARTIIDTYQISHKIPHGQSYKSYSEEYDQEYRDIQNNRDMYENQLKIPFKYKAIGIGIIIAVVLVLFAILHVLAVAVRIFLPVILVLVVIAIIYKSFER